MPLSLYIYIITRFLKAIHMHTHTHIYIILIISKCYCMLSFPEGFLSFLIRRQDTMNIFRTLSMAAFH